MAKKKTKKASEAEKKVEKTGDQASSSNIAYEGKVTVKVLRGSKIVRSSTTHNSGQVRLFYYLCKCLVGTYSQSEAPAYLRMFYGDSISSSEATNTAQPLRSKRPLSSTNSATAEFTFLIPTSAINSQQDGKITTLAIYGSDSSTDKSKPLATVTLSGSDRIIPSSDPGVNIYVKWVMTVMDSATN